MVKVQKVSMNKFMLPLSSHTFFSHILRIYFFMGVLEKLDGEEVIKGCSWFVNWQVHILPSSK